jgi:hypothetical protein
MKLSNLVRSFVVVGAVVGLAGCAAEGDDENGTAEGAVEKVHNTFDIDFGGKCVGKESPKVSFTVKYPQAFWNSVTQTVPGLLVLKDPADGWKELARKDVNLRQNGWATGTDDRVDFELPRELKNTKLKLELRVNFEDLKLSESSEEFRQASAIVSGTQVVGVSSSCSEDNSWWLEDLELDVKNPTSQVVYETAVRKAFTANNLPAPTKGTVYSDSSCGETGFPLAGKALVTGPGGGARLVIIQELHNYTGKRARYRIVTVDRNFGTMGRNWTFDIPKMVNKENLEFADVIGMAVASTDGATLGVTLLQPDCSK